MADADLRGDPFMPNDLAAPIANWDPDALRSLPYELFLLTAYWKWVRDCVLELDDYKCALCGSTDRPTVHHKSYRHHGYEHLHAEDLMVVCYRCHKRLARGGHS